MRGPRTYSILGGESHTSAAAAAHDCRSSRLQVHYRKLIFQKILITRPVHGKE